jgi:hypothetical protein
MTDQIAPKQIISLLKAINIVKTKVASINGEVGERVRAAVENGNVNSRALKQIAAEIRMDEDKRNDFQRSLALYRDIATEAGLFGEEHTGDLLETAEASGDDFEGIKHSNAAAENAKALNGGIKQLEDDDEDQGPSDYAAGERKPRGRPRKAPLSGGDAPGSYKSN